MGNTNASGLPESLPPPQSGTGVQELNIYELNERDRGSPKVLALGGSKDPATGNHVTGLGDLVPFSNKVRPWLCLSHQIPSVCSQWVSCFGVYVTLKDHLESRTYQ